MRHLQKPKHKENVIATEKGWVVERTGELLVAVRGLSSLIANSTADELKIPEVNTTSDENLEAINNEPKVEESLTEQPEAKAKVTEGEQEPSEEKVSEVVDEKPKSKRGGWRPRKPKVEEPLTEQPEAKAVEGEQEPSEEKSAE